MPRKPAPNGDNLTRLEQIVDTLAASVVRHNRQIGAQSRLIEAHSRQIADLIKLSEQNARRWQQLHTEWRAYLRTIRPQ